MLSTLLSAFLVINELMASNLGEVMSPATNFDSWIELYNPGDEDVSLGGMYLSNDINNLTLWRIPESVGSVPAKGFKVIWLGSNDIRSDQATFKLDCDGGVIYLSDANGTTIINQSYPYVISHTAYARTTDGGNEWGWTATPTPEATNTTATFASQRLAAPNVNVGSQLFNGSLSIKVDIPEGATLMYTTDGSVPMPPLADSSLGGTQEDAPDPTWTNWVINGDCEGDDATSLVSRDADGSGDEKRILDGVGYNGSRGIKVHSIKGAGNDWDAQFFVYTPGHIWRSGDKYHFSMKVRADKNARISAQTHTTPHNYIYWSILNGNYDVTTEWQEISYDGVITDQQVRVDGSGDLRDLQTIAFNLNIDKNQDNNFYFDDIVWQSKYDEPIPFNITVRDNPGQRSENGIFSISSTTNYCFRLFKDGYLPSVPVTRSYIQTSNQYTIPIVSIVGDEKYFTDDMWGIDVVGTNGKPGNGRDDAVNWNMDWDRPVNFSYISPTDGMLFNQDVNISVSGGWSRKDSPRSFKLKSNKAFDGLNRFDYSFFPQKPYIRNKALLVRNGGNDSWCRFKDPAMTTIIQRSGIDLDVQSTVQVAEYVNGEFRGILNLRETNNDKFVYANWGYDDEEIDAFENFVFKNGTDVAWNELLELSGRINEAGVYDEVKALLDIDEFTNYMAAELYLGNSDWPNNNVKGYRSQQDGRFRFIIFDLDQIFNYWCAMSSISTLDTDFANEPLVRLFRNLLSNDEYRKKFIDTFCIIGGSVFESGRVTTIVDDLAKAMRPMMQQYDNRNPNSSANEIKEKMQTRFDVALDQLQEYGPAQTGGLQKQNVQFTTDTPGAHILLNGIDVPYADFNGYLFQPVRLEAVAPAGYRFAGWTSAASITALNSLIATGDQWKYYDQGEAASNWKSVGFNDATWSNGDAPLGYGEKMTGVKTTVSFGSDSQRKNPTTYFRKSFQIDGTPTSSDVFKLNYQVDDGCVIYINGTEAGRVTMREGTVSYETFSSTYAGDNPFTGTLDLSPSLFKQGTNVIAVEVHNTSYTSSDLFWACELQTSVGADDGESAIIDPVIDLPAGNSVSLIAKFVPLTDVIKKDQYITPVRINEVSADDGIYVNEYFKRTDWVELYNTTDQPIDVEGMYLTDNLDNPEKYKITKGESAASTIIPAHGYLIVWCDKKDPLSQLHASFKIDASGDDLMLTAADGSWSDILTYPAHKSDQTVGRFPDGSNNVYVMNYPTIAKANITSSYVTDVEQPYQPDPASFAAGDANGDGQVDIVDVTYIISYLKESRPADFRFSAADVDKDGLITVADLKYVTNKLLGKE